MHNLGTVFSFEVIRTLKKSFGSSDSVSSRDGGSVRDRILFNTATDTALEELSNKNFQSA